MSERRIPLSFEARAYQGFVRGLRSIWRDDAYRAVVDAATRLGETDPASIERRMRGEPAYELYAWLERHSQQFKYYGRYGVVALAEREATRADAILAEAARHHPERLRLDPTFVIPDYVRAVDTHQHGGGLWSDACDAFAYENATDGFTFSLFESRSPLAVYAEACAERLAREGTNATRIVDLGCTTGGSTRALARAFPSAEVHGCDVCAPVLALAHLRSVEQELPITWHQMSADELQFADASVDLVASHWLFHEMPPAAIRASLAESRRVLRPGGVLVAYDMYRVPGGAVGQWLHAGYAARNNEPFAWPYTRMDMRAELERAGFAGVEIRIGHPEPDAAVAADRLPAARTHYISLVAAAVPR